MKAIALATLTSTALLCAACFVERPSQSFECSDNADCSGFAENRQCRSGYCVVPNCPSDCTSCDEEAQTCLVECSSSASCGNVICPSGWDCTINCIGGNACNDVDCFSGSRCAITCSGTDACRTVDCSSACKCDLACAAGACDTPDCPTVGNGTNQVQCTADGSPTGTCDSSPPGCTSC